MRGTLRAKGTARMKIKYLFATMLALPFFAAVGCDKTNQDSSSTISTTNATASWDTNSVRHDVDNSGINQRDRDTNNLTPGDQGNTQSDIDLTQKIRKALVMDSTYSMTAKNIKIITVDGKVTLRGPVNSDSEKSGIESLAKNIAGDGNVDDQLEIKSNP
jgi:hyperosmotically inducible periplasmic protein